MSNITNNYEPGSCVFEAGSSQNGDVHITGPIYQGGAVPETPLQMEIKEAADNGPSTLLMAGSNGDPIAANEELFHFIHPEVEDSEEVKIHQAVKKLVSRFGIQQICDYLSQMASEKKILLPQKPNVAYDELVRMGMPNGEGFALKTFEKYYRK